MLWINSVTATLFMLHYQYSNVKRIHTGWPNEWCALAPFSKVIENAKTYTLTKH